MLQHVVRQSIHGVYCTNRAETPHMAGMNEQALMKTTVCMLANAVILLSSIYQVGHRLWVEYRHRMLTTTSLHSESRSQAVSSLVASSAT